MSTEIPEMGEATEATIQQEERQEFELEPRMVRNLRGKDYIDVKWRIIAFNQKYPKGGFRSELVSFDPNAGFALFKATAITDMSTDLSARAEAHGSETMNDFGDFIEKAETKAVGRALERLGFGTDAMMHDGDRPVDSPSDQRSVTPQRQQAGSTPQRTQPSPKPPTQQNASPRPAQHQPEISQEVPASAPPAPPVSALSDAVLPEGKRATPAQIGALSRLMTDSGEDPITVPFHFIERRLISDAITRMKNGGASGLDTLWRTIAVDEDIGRSKTVVQESLMTYVSSSDQMARFNTIVAERVDNYVNSWTFLIWAVKVTTLEPNAAEPSLSIYRLTHLMRHAPTEKLAERIHELADSVGSEHQTEEYSRAMTDTFTRIAQEA